MDFSNNLWKNIEDNHIDNTIVIINADDLRAKGVNISKGLSWEKTGLDFIWQMKNNPKLKFLANCKHLIVPLGLEGAIYFKNEKKPSSRLYFLTYEFDSNFETKLGWLKYFLAPMQDGLFMEGSSLHPIGKAIFVFAGGTCNTYESFVGEKLEEGKEYKDFISDFQSSKGPDFISRLRGYVNILGPNQTDKKWDQLFIIRRAMLLRSLLVRKVPHLINDNGEAQVDNGVIRALLKIPRYKHESRSMEAILEMSRLSDASKWEQSHLPSKSQLKLHVDEEQFYHYMMQAEFFSEKTRIIAKAIYKQFISIYSEYNNMNIDKITSYNMLSEEEKSCIYKQVKNIPSILHKMNYEVYSVKEKPQSITIAQRELYILAEHQHKLWVIQRKQDGWKYGEIFDENEKLDPSLVSWNKLSENIKNKMIEYINLWTEILVESNLKVEKLNYLCYCDSQRSN